MHIFNESVIFMRVTISALLHVTFLSQMYNEVRTKQTVPNCLPCEQVHHDKIRILWELKGNKVNWQMNDFAHVWRLKQNEQKVYAWHYTSYSIKLSTTFSNPSNKCK